MGHRRLNWRSGLGEMLSFAIIAPLLVFLIAAIISATQISIAEQNLTLACYTTGRAAAVATSLDNARSRARSIMQITYGANYTDGAPSTNGQAGYTLVVGSHSGAWRKGDIMIVTVMQYIEPIMPFTSGTRFRSLAMMIENQKMYGL